jgi:hypothetical protein
MDQPVDGCGEWPSEQDGQGPESTADEDRLPPLVPPKQTGVEKYSEGEGEMDDCGYGPKGNHSKEKQFRCDDLQGFKRKVDITHFERSDLLGMSRLGNGVLSRGQPGQISDSHGKRLGSYGSNSFLRSVGEP